MYMSDYNSVIAEFGIRNSDFGFRNSFDLRLGYYFCPATWLLAKNVYQTFS